MDPRPHRFLQYLQEITPGEHWHELPALDGGATGPRRPIASVEVVTSGRALREIKLGVRVVLKQVARLLYLSPLLIALRFALGSVDRAWGDWVIFGFVLLVVTFFALLNLYIVWSVVVYFASRRGLGVVPPFSRDSGACERLRTGGAGELVRKTGVVTRLCPPLVGSHEVLRDLWAASGSAPWRLTECVDFAVVVEGEERPVILRFESAPLVVSDPEVETVGGATARLSPGTNSVFDLGPALAGERAGERAEYLTIAEGEVVEVTGRLAGVLPALQRFELGSRVCALGGASGADPYRGASGREGLLVTSTAADPVCLRKL